MRVLSLFSGVGGFDMGLEAAGMETVFQCEIDKHAMSVLEHKWPHTEKWDDVTTLTGAYVLEKVGAVDVVAWGSPCQDLSLAGKRKGLSGERSGLFHQGIRIIKEMREISNGQYPKWSVWENVYGALSSNGGADFGQVLFEMDEAGACFSEWAVLDAQYFGVPQRRRRVFVTSCFDSATAERCANPLFPVAESSSGNSSKGRQKKEATPREAESGPGDDGPELREGFASSSFGSYVQGVGVLKANGGDIGGGSETLITEPMVFQPGAVVRMGAKMSSTTAPTLRAMANGGDNSPHVIQSGAIGFGHTQGLDIQASEDAFPTLRMNGNGLAVAQPIPVDLDDEMVLIDGRRSNDVRVYTEPVQTLEARMGTGGNNVPVIASSWAAADKGDGILSGSVTSKWHKGSGGPAGDEHYNLVVAESYDEYNDTLGGDTHHALRAGTKQSTGVLTPEMAVRRLTPLECERLMGWPDNHTSMGANGPISDSQRYKMCGNGVASPVAQWIGEIIAKQ